MQHLRVDITRVRLELGQVLEDMLLSVGLPHLLLDLLLEDPGA